MDSNANLDELTELVYEYRSVLDRQQEQLDAQQREIEALKRARRSGRRLRLGLAPLALLISAAVVAAPSFAAGKTGNSSVPPASGSPYTEREDVGDPGKAVAEFAARAGAPGGGWDASESDVSGTAIHAQCLNGTGCRGIEAEGQQYGVHAVADAGTGVSAVGTSL